MRGSGHRQWYSSLWDRKPKEAIDFMNGDVEMKPVEYDTREVFADTSNQYAINFSDVKVRIISKSS